MATDLAEVLGGAIALNILFDLPLLLGGLITGMVSTGLLAVQNRRGQGPFERAITGLLGVIAIGFFARLFVSPPSLTDTLGGLRPAFDGADSVLLAAGMLGATVMPHAMYLHSALARDRHGRPDGTHRKAQLTATRYDVGTAMLLAGAVNLAMLLLAATALQGQDTGGSLQGARRRQRQPRRHHRVAVRPRAARVRARVYLCRPLRRRGQHGRPAAPPDPAAAAPHHHPDPRAGGTRDRRRPTQSLVISQFVLSFGIPLAPIPLLRLTSHRTVMGEATNHTATIGAACVAVTAVVALNLVLLDLTVVGID